MGTSELYSAVEALPEVLDSMVVDLEYLGRESYMPLFVVLREGVVLDDALRGRLNKQIAVDLGIDERSVKRHRTSIMTKLKVQSVAELTHLVHAAGLHGTDIK